MPDAVRPARITLVLSAGGLRGAAHVGVLKQLLRHEVPIDAIVGVSAGAVIAAYYAAAGLSIDELVTCRRRSRHDPSAPTQSAVAQGRPWAPAQVGVAQDKPQGGSAISGDPPPRRPRRR